MHISSRKAQGGCAWSVKEHAPMIAMQRHMQEGSIWHLSSMWKRGPSWELHLKVEQHLDHLV